MSKTKKIAVFTLALIILLVPALSLAVDPPSSSGLVPCDKNCDFKQLMVLIHGVINFVLFKMAVPLAAIMFAYAGFLLVTAGGEAAHARTKAKDIFTNVVIGLVIAIAAWLIISLVLSTLGYDGAWIGL